MGQQGVRKNILVVDDEDVISTLIQHVLEGNENYKVFRATNGADAFAKIKTSQVDLICLDFRMPKMNGAEFYHLVRNSKLNSKVPIIFVTGNLPEVKQLIPAEPLLKFLEKPFDFDDLSNAADELLGLADKAKETPTTLMSDNDAMKTHLQNAAISTLKNMIGIQKISNTPFTTRTASGKGTKSIGPIQVSLKNNQKVSGIVLIKSDRFSAAVIVNFPEITLLRIHNHLLGEKLTQVNSEVASTAGELTNMIWAKTKFLSEERKLNFTNTVPTVTQTQKDIFFPNELSSEEMILSTELGNLGVCFTLFKG